MTFGTGFMNLNDWAQSLSALLTILCRVRFRAQFPRTMFRKITFGHYLLTFMPLQTKKVQSFLWNTIIVFLRNSTNQNKPHKRIVKIGNIWSSLKRTIALQDVWNKKKNLKNFPSTEVEKSHIHVKSQKCPSILTKCNAHVWICRMENEILQF